MSQSISFNRDYTSTTGELEVLTPWLRRITAANPGPFTFRGTGTYVVGSGQVTVIDPGPDDSSHIEALMGALGEETITHILVTHAHQDHSPACAHLKRYTNAPVYAFAAPGGQAGGRLADAGFDQSFRPERPVADGDIIDAGECSFECIHTPGHTSDHVCFSLPEQKALFCGDHVMGWSTSIVSPPDGNMGDYMRSLQRLLHRDEAVYWPTHGGPIEQPQQFVQWLIDHRLEREKQILGCVTQGHNTIAAMLPLVYADISPQLYPAAERSLQATIEYLVEKKQLKRVGPTFLNRAGPI